VLGVVQFGLDSRREELDDLDIACAVLQLFSQYEQPLLQQVSYDCIISAMDQTYVKSGLGRAVVARSDHWHKRETGRSVNKRSLLVLLLQVWKESHCEMKVRSVVGGELLLDHLEVNSLRLGEVKRTLNATVEQDTVNLRVRLHDILCECWDLVELGNVECESLGLV